MKKYKKTIRINTLNKKIFSSSILLKNYKLDKTKIYFL